MIFPQGFKFNFLKKYKKKIIEKSKTAFVS